jgi:hypothetical protein
MSSEVARPFIGMWITMLVRAAIIKGSTFQFRGRAPYVPSTREARRSQ